MTSPTWRFAPLNGGVKQGLSIGGMETFKGSPFDALAREICQNSLDAHDPDSLNPVEVTFSKQLLDKNSYDVFKGLEKCFEQCKKGWDGEADYNLTTFLDRAKTTMSADEIPVLKVSDYNTTGLTGSDADIYAKTLWNSLTSADGVSDKPSGSGGSYGIGKLAPFVCSSFNAVLYSTYAKDEKRAFQGVARLASLLDDQGQQTQGVGQYRINEERNWRPIKETDLCPLRDQFQRKEYGTDIMILGFRNEENWEKVVVDAITRNFFVAIAEKNLVVKVEDTIIDDTTLEDLLSKNLDTKEMVNFWQLYSAFNNPDDVVKAKIFAESEEETDVELYIKTGSNLNKQQAYIKRTGMLVRKRGRKSFVSYAAVLVIRGKELAELLVEAEPPAHDNWNAENIDKDPERKKIARRVIRDLYKWIDEVISGKQDDNTGKSIDAGIGEYLPDDTTGIESEDRGEDELRVNQKLSKKAIRTKTPKSTTAGGKGVGTPTEEGYRNKKKRETIPPIIEPSPPVVSGKGDTKGITRKKGPKQLEDVAMTASRIIPLNTSCGLYRIVLTPSESVPAARISVSSIAEDGSLKAIPITSCKLNSETAPCNEGEIGPLLLNADKTLELYANLDSNETLALKLKVSEVI